MKFLKNKCLLVTIFAIVLLSGIIAKSLKHKKNRQVHLVRDMNGFNSNIQQVFRRDPTVTTVTKMGNYRLSPPNTHLYASNSNTSTAPNVGFLGHTAEIVGKF